jgi:hypothetical protein
LDPDGEGSHARGDAVRGEGTALARTDLGERGRKLRASLRSRAVACR